ncbi:MAG: hypothetical protein GY806_20580 [Gammaproteobacteria bacterium]|nr:hypothetical protein [Gammaproteobacteria bacterium]
MMLFRLAIISLILSSSACGFHLRGLANLPEQISDIQLIGDNLDNSQQARLTQILRRAGARFHVNGDSSAVRLQVSIKTLPERLLVDSVGSGQSIVRLAKELNYSVIEANGNRLVDNKTLTSTFDLELDENNLLANAGEKQAAGTSIADNLFNRMLIQLQRL